MSQDQARLVLGVDADATPEEVRSAFRACMQLVHPDRARDLSEAVQRQATIKAQQVSEAYEVLRAAAPREGSGRAPRADHAAGTPPRPRREPPPTAPPPRQDRGRTRPPGPADLLECTACGKDQEVPRGEDVYACTACRSPLFLLTCPSSHKTVQVWGVGPWRCPCGRTHPNPLVVTR